MNTRLIQFKIWFFFDSEYGIEILVTLKFRIKLFTPSGKVNSLGFHSNSNLYNASRSVSF